MLGLDGRGTPRPFRFLLFYFIFPFFPFYVSLVLYVCGNRTICTSQGLYLGGYRGHLESCTEHSACEMCVRQRWIVWVRGVRCRSMRLWRAAGREGDRSDNRSRKLRALGFSVLVVTRLGMCVERIGIIGYGFERVKNEAEL